MATRPIQFVPIPSLPQIGLQPWQFQFLLAIKENLERLMGAADGTDKRLRAVTSGQITVQSPPAQQMTKLTATGAGVSISGASVPSAEDHLALMSDVQTLINDVASLRATVESLINQLKG